MAHLRAFIAGFLSTLVFHQGMLALLRLSGASARVPYDMTPSSPLVQVVPERLIGYAPVMAPLLFSNMGIVGLVVLLPEREQSA